METFYICDEEMNKMTGLLTQEKIMNCPDVPNWLTEEYQTFRSIVTSETFPCFFGLHAEKRGELRYGYISQKDWSSLPLILTEFLALFPTRTRHGLFLFVEPERKEQSLDYYRDYFWRVLQYIHEKDTVNWPQESPKDPDHHLWDFHFKGEPIFAFGNAPAYKQRKTRHLGNSLIIGFQPRHIFKGLEGTEKGGIMSREKVRERVEVWDGLSTHPDISHYGDIHHNEWKQFFIGDDIEPIKGKCPFSHKSL